MIKKDIKKYGKVIVFEKGEDQYVIDMDNKAYTSRIADYLENRSFRIDNKIVRISPMEVVYRYRSNTGYIIMEIIPEGEVSSIDIEEKIMKYVQEFIEYHYPERP